MTSAPEIVITGMGVVSPIGIGAEAFWESLCRRRSGIRRLDVLGGSDLPAPLAAEVTDFDPKRFIRPRKSLKVMSRDIQLGFAAADMACQQAAIAPGSVDPERLGVVFGADMIACELPDLEPAYAKCIDQGRFDFSRWGNSAMAEMYPLWMLKYLPNMPACHIGIAQDARGPNNSLTLGEVSSLAAVIEAIRVLRRGQADVTIAGGTGYRIPPSIWAYRRVHPLSEWSGDPATAVRPFDADRDGMVYGEGAGAVVLEMRHRAEARGATILARIGGFAAAFEPRRSGQEPDGRAIRQSIEQALDEAGLAPADVGHVNAHGLGTPWDDRLEAQAIHDTLGDAPVTALKSYFGNLGAGGGAVELVASVLALQHSAVPPVLNYQTPDPQCPVNVIRDEPLVGARPTALVLNQSRIIQAMTLLLLAP